MCLLLAPTAAAGVSFIVSNGDHRETTIETESDAYTFSLVAPHFSGNDTGNGSVDTAYVEFAYDYGHVASDMNPDVSTIITVENSTKAVTIRIHQFATQGWLSRVWARETEVYVDDELQWDRAMYDFTHPWGGIDFSASAIIGFGQNRSLVNDTTSGPVTYGTDHDETYPGGELAWVPGHSGDQWLATSHPAYHTDQFYHLANLTGITAVTVEVNFQTIRPQGAVAKYRFETVEDKTAREAGTDESCPGAVLGILRGIIGFCPTIEGVGNHIGSFFGFGLGLLLAPIDGACGGCGSQIADAVASLVSNVIGLFLIVLAMILVKPHLFVIFAFTIILSYSLMMAGLEADPMYVWKGVKMGVVGLALFLYWYFRFVWLVASWTYNFILAIIKIVTDAITGLIPG